MLGIFSGMNTPEPMPTMTVDPSSVTPGVVGFGATALLAAVVVLLIWDLLRRIRRVRYRAEINESLDAEQSAQGGDDAPAGSTPEASEPDATDDPDR